MDQAKKADAWAADVWKRGIKNWAGRKQDYNYRRFLARPGMREEIGVIDPIAKGIFLDLGCGDGSEMRHIARFLREKGCGGKFFGFDLQKPLIEIAKSKIRQKKPIEMVFDFGQLVELTEKHDLAGRVDLIFSTFLLQELADAESYFKLSAGCLKRGGRGIFLFLHPAFGKAMLKKGAVRVNENLKSKTWRWAAEYPIVEEGGGTFYVPYFHRELDDYVRLAKKYFSTVDFHEYQPVEKIIRKCKKELLSPFYDHPGNVYYPEIVEIPSAIVFVVRK